MKLIDKGCAVRDCPACGNPVILRRGVIDAHQSQGRECVMTGKSYLTDRVPEKG